MKTVDIKHLKYNKATKTFHADGNKVIFDTSYVVVNKETNNSMLFNFSHSTGSEWDRNTLWVYKGDNGITLELTNCFKGEEKTNYFNAKYTQY